MALQLLSPAFSDRAPIPVAHTCDGENAAPPLGWSGAPPHTVSFALIVDDPDAPDPAAPTRTFVHWVAWDIPAGVTEIAEGGLLPDGAQSGRNDAGTAGYTGPCPPIGRHRYFFKLYALDTLLGALGEATTKADLERAMEGHVLDQAQTVGTYLRGGA
jgi:Raf kinase inhibitor-like YbhB/YbcL family protein